MTQLPSEQSDAVTRLARDVRLLKVYCAVLTAALIAASLLALARPTELALEQLRVVEASGVERLSISNASRTPQPRVRGTETVTRANQPAGLIFFDGEGHEVGGLVLTDAKDGKAKQAALSFDYINADAVGLLARVSADGADSTAGLLINSRPPADMDLHAASTVQQTRITVMNHNEEAEIMLADPAGRPRIRLAVDATGRPQFQILDERGNVSFQAPQE